MPRRRPSRRRVPPPRTMDAIKDQVTPVPEAPIQGGVDANKEKVLNDPLGEQVDNAEFRDAIMLLARTVNVQLNQQKITLMSAGSKKKKGVNKMNAIREKSRDFKRARTDSGSSFANAPVSRPNKEGRPFPPCERCGKTHQGECMAGKKGCYKCGDIGHKMRDCPVASRKGRDSKRARCESGTSQSKPGGGFRASTISKCSKCGKNHRGECLAGLNACFRCGKSGHHARECRSSTRPRTLAQTTGHPNKNATTSDGGQRQTDFMPFKITRS
jgi:hypothetical protein